MRIQQALRILVMLCVPSLLHADPCTMTLDQDGQTSMLLINGPVGWEVFDFGLQIDTDFSAVIIDDSCSVYGKAEATDDPFMFAAIYGLGGFTEVPWDTPMFGKDIAWQSESGSFQSLPFSDEPISASMFRTVETVPIPEPPAVALILAGLLLLQLTHLKGESLERKETK